MIRGYKTLQKSNLLPLIKYQSNRFQYQHQYQHNHKKCYLADIKKYFESIDSNDHSFASQLIFIRINNEESNLNLIDQNRSLQTRIENLELRYGDIMRVIRIHMKSDKCD